MADIDLNAEMAAMVARLQEQKASLAALRQEVASMRPPGQAGQPAPANSFTTRRQTLKLLLAGLTGALAVTASTAAPQEIEAKSLAGSDNRIGWITAPLGAAPTTSLNQAAVTNYGIVGLSGSLSMGTMLPNVSTAIVGLSDTGYGIYGYGSAGMVATSTNNSGMVGETISGDGVRAEGNKNTGLYATAFKGRTLVAESVTGAPLRIVPGFTPSVGLRYSGEMYVDFEGNLYIYTNNGQIWRKIKFV